MLGEQVGHYRLESKLGSGTYGVVYRGVHQEDSGLQVAIKVVHPSLLEDPKFVESLKSECRRLDKLDHNAIVRFRDLVLRQVPVSRFAHSGRLLSPLQPSLRQSWPGDRVARARLLQHG